MRKIIIGNCINFIKKYHPEYDEEKVSIIKYGLESIYIMITKLIFIFALAIILKIFKEVLIFLLIYNIIRTFSFGLHATKSWICLLTSSIIFIFVPIMCKYIIISNFIKSFIGIILILLFFKNAPADTVKRPIISKKRRMFFKYTSVIISIIFVFLSILVNDLFLSNCFIFALIVQSFMISPLVYKTFKLPYNNYLSYQTV